MARFLFVVPPLVGHTNPTIGTAAALAARGHQVAWAGHLDLLGQLAGPDARIFPCAVAEHAANRTAEVKGPAALKFLWAEFLVPLADAMAPGVRAAMAEFDPDIVVADQQALAGSLLAEAAGRTWVTSATTSAELLNPLAGMPKVVEWVAELVSGLRDRIADGIGSADPLWSPHGVLAYTTRALLGPIELPGQVWLVGPAISGRPATSEFPWDWLDPNHPTVLITLGTANADAAERFLRAAVAAVDPNWRAVVVDPGGQLACSAPNLLVRREVPQLALLPKLAAVVCHAGHNTVCEALWHGVPLVVAPIRDDQPIVAQQVVAAGAGIRLRFGRADPPRINAAIEQVLTEPGYRSAAEAVGSSFRAAGGSATAADRLAALVN